MTSRLRVTHPLLGTWRKASAEPCGQLYPAELEIGPFRLRGRRIPGDTGFIIWDVGTVEVAGSTATFSTATDAVVSYPFEVADDLVTFTDERGCRITYQRMP